jgi:hypothetical protein
LSLLTTLALIVAVVVNVSKIVVAPEPIFAKGSDHNASINILYKGLDSIGHTKFQNPCGQINLWIA